jgi:Ca-activated chloride channel family protein
MHVAAHLDVDLIAVEADDEVSVLIELTAPPAPEPDPTVERPVHTLQVVLDRSGSMGGRIEGAIAALLALVDRLDPKDNFGLVAFDDRVELTVPAGPLTDKASVKRAMESLHARGSTDLSAGFLRGIQEARKVAGPAGATLLLISDGHANAGVVDPEALGAIGADAYRSGVTTSTLGWGLGYDEQLLAAIARGGSGNHLFAEESDNAVAKIAGEVDGLLSQTAQAASVLIGLSKHVRAVRVVNDLPTTASARGIIAELGSFYGGERRRLVLTFDVPAVADLGLTEIATLEFTYVELPALKQHTISVPLHVNVVPGDQAEGRVPNPVVRTELVYQTVQQAKRSAAESLAANDGEKALATISEARELVRRVQSTGDLPAEILADLEAEEQSLKYMHTGTARGEYLRMSKFGTSEHLRKSHKRGRSETAPVDYSDDPDDASDGSPGPAM